jgi:Tol biopolymer transport system component
MTWLDRTGKRLSTIGERGHIYQVVLSPDSKRAAYVVIEGTRQGGDIFRLDLARRIPTRFTFPPDYGDGPVWSPEPLLKSEGGNREAAFSPDGKFIAYSGSESTRYEIFVQPDPPTGAKWQISKNGGRFPRWRGDGRELFWLESDGTVMSSQIDGGGSFLAATPTTLFETGLTGTTVRYSVTPDMQRFLVPVPVEEMKEEAVATVVVEYFVEVKLPRHDVAAAARVGSTV